MTRNPPNLAKRRKRSWKNYNFLMEANSNQTYQTNQAQGLRLILGQFIRFAVIGVVNTGIDFGILNVLVWITGITAGSGLIPLNIISFTVAVINSYFLNKYWAFRDKSSGQDTRKFTIFLAVSIVGALINTATVTGIATYVSPLFDLSPQLWVNVAKVVATGLSLIWNFVGYKFFVFKK